MKNDLKKRVMHSLKWSIVGKFLTQLFSWVSTFLVIRILTPEDYGIIAVTTTIFSFASFFGVQGFVTSLVKFQTKDSKTSSQVFTIALMIYCTYSAGIYFSADWIGQFYDNQGISEVLKLLAIAMPFNCLTIIPIAYLNIDMNFKRKTICESITGLLVAIVTLSLAYLGYEYWSLVYSRVFGILMLVLLLNSAISGRYFITKNLKGSAEWLYFTIKIQINGIIWFIYNKADTLIVGKFLGVEKAGIYNVAVEIASIPAIKVSNTLNQVGFSAFSTLSSDMKQNEYYLRKSISLVSLCSFPIFAGISVTANEMIMLLVGEKWIQSAPLIVLFAWVFSFRMLRATIQNYTNAMGKPTFNIQNTLITAIILIPSIYYGAQHGVEMTAAAWVIAYFSAFIVVLIRLKLIYKLKYGTLLTWLPKFIVSAIMAACIYLIQEYELIQFYFSVPVDNLLYLFAYKILFGIFFIVLTYFLFFREETKMLLKSLR